MKRIGSEDLICLNDYTNTHALRIDLAYAQNDNLLFGERIYHENARLWAHKDLADIIVKAAKIAEQKNLRLIAYDSLRTTDAQEKMLHTQRVKNNPHWLEPPRLLSPPGTGAHPRGMAIDVSLETMDGTLLDMGTPFDYLNEESSAPEINAAHREHPHLSNKAKQNRKILDECMFTAAKECGQSLIGLPEEWWDFRFPAEIYNAYRPLSDKDLPENMRMVL